MPGKYLSILPSQLTVIHSGAKTVSCSCGKPLLLWPTALVNGLSEVRITIPILECGAADPSSFDK